MFGYYARDLSTRWQCKRQDKSTIESNKGQSNENDQKMDPEVYISSDIPGFDIGQSKDETEVEADTNDADYNCRKYSYGAPQYVRYPDAPKSKLKPLTTLQNLHVGETLRMWILHSEPMRFKSTRFEILPHESSVTHRQHFRQPK